ncbi:hypothetical protein DO97_05720 [Neosynechococcus sphagnicola sy1]|uniref:PPM-type phosphatase domain-containing protein n=1 Tax=Neosynechococcus sphagnicola sy1 TaxID=1497020 RepID=A0A098TNM8_9CYAN|nr:protein phosphatase 2C domain-containing protein [Neosynechococcus sphagnicola]KGF73866.1 hypothetical protein DO97_05720 [Neosynechococcus sphagnicola sy1]
MQGLFTVAAGSITGRDHQWINKNNQDAYYLWRDSHSLIAVVCDGCGSRPHSEVGAKIGARLVVETIRRSLIGAAMDLNTAGFWQQIRQEILGQLQQWAIALGGDFVQTVLDYFLFTLAGTVITPTTTWIFSIGDGVIILNSQIQELGPFPDNAPPYLAYGLLASGAVNTEFQLHSPLPTPELQTLLIGTDGVSELMQIGHQCLPGKQEFVQPIDQFWQEDRYFSNPDCLRRRLTLINREVVRLNPRSQQLEKQPGLLPDDTTLIVIKRCPS